MMSEGYCIVTVSERKVSWNALFVVDKSLLLLSLHIYYQTRSYFHNFLHSEPCILAEYRMPKLQMIIFQNRTNSQRSSEG